MQRPVKLEPPPPASVSHSQDVNSSQLLMAVLLTVPFGVSVVTFVAPLNIFMFILWLGATVTTLRRLHTRISKRHFFNIAISSGLTMIVIYAGAFFAPVKLIDAILEKPVDLQSTRMTVAQLSERCWEDRKSFPLRIYLPSEGTVSETELHFDTARMPLKQFIRQIEVQTGMVHYFAGCGNSYTVLRGPTYEFGLSFQPSTSHRRK